MENLILEKAFEKTDSIINCFENVINESWEKEYPTRSFTKAVTKMTKPNTEEVDPNSSSDDRFYMDLNRLSQECSNCKRCKLCKGRKKTVFGEGCTDDPVVLVIGEGPGEQEDLTGRPFVGPAGELLDKMLASISLSRTTNTYITNIVKCRPPMNRDPEGDEKIACRAFLTQQIALLRPKAILCLGKPASTLMTGQEDSSMGQLRGKFFFYDNSIPMICTYHPSALLRDASYKTYAWEDLKKLAAFLKLEVHSKK